MLSIRKSGAALGAEITNVDFSRETSHELFNAVTEALYEHEVIFFRNQSLTPEQHIALSRRFGELELHVRADCCKPGYPEIFVVSNVVENGKPIGARDAGVIWHSDLSYMREPSWGSVFYAKEVPVDSNGVPTGDTMFASTTAAYAALPAETKAKLQGLKSLNSYAKGYARVRKGGQKLPPLTEEQKSKVQDAAHPVVRTHPATGRQCLFVNQGYTTKIIGTNEAESDALLGYLIAHISDQRFVYRHSWHAGDLLIWDNCSTQHCAINDYDLPQRRLMERTTLRGSVPY